MVRSSKFFDCMRYDGFHFPHTVQLFVCYGRGHGLAPLPLLLPAYREHPPDWELVLGGAYTCRRAIRRLWSLETQRMHARDGLYFMECDSKKIPVPCL